VSWQGHNYLFETFIDITARKKTETELRLQKDLIERILSASPNAEVVIGEDGKIIMANRTFCGWFGSKTRLELISDVIPVQELADAVLESRLNEHLKNEVEFRLSVGGGERRIFVCRILPMLKTEMLLIISDITEERDRLERLQLSERLVSVGEMASGVAHELNNPLTSVIALSQLLLKTDLSPDTREDLEAIYGEARRAAEVVKNLLTFARKHTPEKKLTQINGIIQDVIKLRAYEHKVNNIQVKTIFDPELPNIMVDSFQMQQVFLNLILNAEFAIIQTHKPGTITLSTETLSGNVKIVCKDDGPGISPENMKHLFNPFFTTKEVGKGTGLGLSICFGLISGHAGRIYAESKPGEGAAFIIELPVPPVPMQAATANAK
jgi:signal transduction histidine kinase